MKKNLGSQIRKENNKKRLDGKNVKSIEWNDQSSERNVVMRNSKKAERKFC